VGCSKGVEKIIPGLLFGCSPTSDEHGIGLDEIVEGAGGSNLQTVARKETPVLYAAGQELVPISRQLGPVPPKNFSSDAVFKGQEAVVHSCSNAMSRGGLLSSLDHHAVASPGLTCDAGADFVRDIMMRKTAEMTVTEATKTRGPRDSSASAHPKRTATMGFT